MDDDSGRQEVAFQGERGAYSEAAAVAFFGEQIFPRACETFDTVFARVEAGESSYGVVPIENSLAGSIHRNYDLLLRHSLFIVGEYNLRVAHHLIALPGVEVGDVRRVYSHPQALAQCERSLAALGDVERVATYDTAGSVRMLKDEGIRDGAAIASRRAAEIYGMSILASDFEDNSQNYTRFIVLHPEEVTPQGPAKTSIVFSVGNEPGALFKCLSVFALRDIDLTKIESRPLQGRPWEYFFYLDFAGSMEEERCRNAIHHLQEITIFFRNLGSYPRSA
jgi:prephenate dehydratase